MGFEKNKTVRIIAYIVLTIWAIFTIFPIYWTLVTSVKTSQVVYSNQPAFVPFLDFMPSLQPWTDIFGAGGGYGVSGMGNVWKLVTNSAVAAFSSALSALILGSAAAYALSRFRFRKWKNENIAFWFISQRMLPPVALAVPYFILFSALRILDRLPTLILVYTAMNLPLVVWLLRDYFAELPVEIEESALVDGCSRLGAFIRIALPLAVPGLAVAFLFSFVFAWNEFIFALTLTFNTAKTLPFQLAGNVTLRGPRYWDIAAQGATVMIPPMIIALLAAKYIVRGLTLGAVK